MKRNQWLNQGLKEMEAGNSEEGRRWLLYALQDQQLDNKSRAVAYTWLAEAATDRAQKREYYEAALDADPQNDYAQDKLTELRRPPRQQPVPPPTLPESQNNPLVTPRPPAPIYVPSSAPPPPRAAPIIQEAPPIYPTEPETRRTDTGTLRPVAPPPPYQPRSSHYVIGILGGPNGPGSGFFLTATGIIATTRHVVGGSETMTVALEAGQQVEARVVRSFPEIDVALLYSGQGTREMLTTTPFDQIAENTPISVLSYPSIKVEGQRRETGRTLASHLFPTDIIQLPDAGGGPVFNYRQEVVGMITRNISSSSAYVYGIHYAAIKHCLDRYNYELQQVAQRVYCSSCGYASAAGTIGGFYCEVCGTIMPHAQGKIRVQNHQMAAFYSDNTYRPCIVCSATIGYYKGLCLRCGQAGDPDLPPAGIR